MSDPRPNENPGWWNIALFMQDMSRTLPADWDHGTEFLLEAVQNLAEVIVMMREHGLPLKPAANLLGVGGILIAQAVKETEAADLTAALMARLNNGEAR